LRATQGVIKDKIDSKNKIKFTTMSLKQRLKKFDKKIHSGEVMQVDKLISKERV
jgi:hypothetical protein